MQMFDLAEMKRAMAELDRQRHSLATLISAAEAYQAAVVRNVSNATQGNSTPRSLVGSVIRQMDAAPGSHKTVQAITEDVALERIASTKLPVQTRDVINIMQERGLPLPNKNVVNVVSARLSNSERLEGRRGLGWWPKGMPWPHEEPAMFGDDHNEDPRDPDSAYDDYREQEALNENGEAEASPDAEGVAAPSTDIRDSLEEFGI